MFFAVAIWGVVDALRNFQPEVQLSTEPARPMVAPAPTAKTSFRLFSPSLLGLGAEWRF